MIVRGSNYVVIGRGTDWTEDLYPEWAVLERFRYFPGQRQGQGVEPHYHDCDEFWLFVAGRGQAWLDDRVVNVGANTVVYTPLGTVHRFQMFTEFETVDAGTRHEGRKRLRHILVEEDGPPTPTVPGFVAPGEENVGPFSDRGARCPLAELRLVDFASERVDDARLARNEHWVICAGTLNLEVDGLSIDLGEGDTALLRAGATRRLRAKNGTRAAVARE